MKQVDAILDKVQLPPLSFEVKSASNEIIVFEQRGEVALPEGDDELTKIVSQAIGPALTMDASYGEYKYVIRRNQVYDRVNSAVKEFHVKLWMLVNDKVEFRRTKLHKDLAHAQSDKFKNFCLELFLDAAKYGITRNTLHKHTDLKPIHKFIALKFQAMVEAECPK